MPDKFIEDFILAVFGLPVAIAQNNDEDRAVGAAISIPTNLKASHVERVACGESAAQRDLASTRPSGIRNYQVIEAYELHTY